MIKRRDGEIDCDREEWQRTGEEGKAERRKEGRERRRGTNEKNRMEKKERVGEKKTERKKRETENKKKRSKMEKRRQIKRTILTATKKSEVKIYKEMKKEWWRREGETGERKEE
ncbi:uncharacterized [Tachysurus ichikawai]